MFLLIVSMVVYAACKLRAKREAERQSLIPRQIRHINYPDNISFRSSRRSMQSSRKSLRTPAQQDPMESKEQLKEVSEASEREEEQEHAMGIKEVSELQSDDSN